MLKEKIVLFVLAIYRITEKFPEREPLRFILREKANFLLESFILINFQKNPKRVKEEIFKISTLLKNFFLIAKKQNWVKPKNFLILEESLNSIVKAIDQQRLVKFLPSLPEHLPFQGKPKITNERWRKILEILKEKEKLQVSDLQRYFPKVSKRTLRRDFEALLEQGRIVRVGEGRDTFYKLATS